MRFHFSKRSLDRMKGLDARLVILMYETLELSSVDFGIASGVRTLAEQKELYAQGRSFDGNIVTNINGVTIKSKHQTGDAVDIFCLDEDGLISYVPELYNVVNHAARKTDIWNQEKFIWGGDWISFQDRPHYELS